MAKAAKEMQEKGISEEDNGAVLIDFTKQVPGKEGKRLGKAVLRCANYVTRFAYIFLY
jgi:arginyl-tRNA synthetase